MTTKHVKDRHSRIIHLKDLIHRSSIKNINPGYEKLIFEVMEKTFVSRRTAKEYLDFLIASRFCSKEYDKEFKEWVVIRNISHDFDEIIKAEPLDN